MAKGEDKEKDTDKEKDKDKDTEKDKETEKKARLKKRAKTEEKADDAEKAEEEVVKVNLRILVIGHCVPGMNAHEDELPYGVKPHVLRPELPAEGQFPGSRLVKEVVRVLPAATSKKYSL